MTTSLLVPTQPTVPTIRAAEQANIVAPNAQHWRVKSEALSKENRLLREEIARLKQTKVQASNWRNFTATSYTAKCRGCSGFTAAGIDVRNRTHYNGLRVIATDPAVIPLGTTVELRFSDGRVERAIALDKGGAIKGFSIDYLMSDYNSAIQFGRQAIKLRVIGTE